jgi:ubiquinone/menaquinone biosynthesis C-methylase UbiE
MTTQHVTREDWLIRKYSDEEAVNYDANREGSAKWTGEHVAVEGALSDLPSGSRVLDAPVGTGRFFDLYKALGLEFVGVDLSEDMLAQARSRDPRPGLVRVDDCRTLETVRDDSFDAVVCIRLLNLLTPADVRLTLREFARVVRCGGRVIVSLKDAEGAGDSRPRTIHDAALIRDMLAELGLVVVTAVDVPGRGGGRYRVLTLEHGE